MEKDAAIKNYLLVKTLWINFSFSCIALYPILQPELWISSNIMQ